MRYLITVSLLLIEISCLDAQTQIGRDVVMSGESVLATNASITDNRISAQKLGIVTLTGSGILKLAGEWKVNELKVDGTITLDGNITIAGSMFLLNGLIEPSVNSQLLIEEAASAVSENQAFVNGALYRKGHGELFFPTGKNGKYAPITYLEVPFDNSSLYGIEAFDQELVLESLPDEIIQVSDEIYWEALEGIPESPVELTLTPTVKQMETGEDRLTILQANEGLTEVMNLGASTGLSTIRSQSPFTGSHLFIAVQNDNALSFDEQKIATIYPNPFTSELNIAAIGESIYFLRIYDTRGVVIREFMLNGKKTLDTSSYPSGVYLLTFCSKSGIVFTRKMVKQ